MSGERPRPNEKVRRANCTVCCNLLNVVLARKITEEEGVPDVEEEPQSEDDMIHETMFSFEAFELVSPA